MMTDSLNLKLSLLNDPQLLPRLEEFLSLNADEDPVKLRFKLIKADMPPAERSFIDFALLQLEATKKYSSKISSSLRLLYPSMLAGEQASNSEVSDFHSMLIAGAMSLLDMTAGLGIDFITMAKAISPTGKNCVAVELDPLKALVLELNLRRNGLTDAKVVCGDSIKVLSQLRDEGRRFDVIFVDPARRDDEGGRIYDPAHCQPDVVGNAGLLFDVAERVIVKNSPMVDVSKALQIFPSTERLYLVSVRNECKELLTDMRAGTRLKSLTAVDIHSSGNRQLTEVDTDSVGRQYTESHIDEPTLRSWLEEGHVWIYEPSATLMKLASWNDLARRYGLKKGSPNSHIFFSREFHEDFPGRVLLIERILDKKGMKELKGEPRNVVTRNYPLKAEPLSKKLRVNSGDDRFIYGLTISPDEHPMLLDTIIC